MQAYSNPKRESDPYSLPDVEVFYHQHERLEECTLECTRDEDGNCLGTGYYWWSCFPGCMPDSGPCGPFATREEAIADAQDGCDDTDEE